jgi:hypothetical protein
MINKILSCSIYCLVGLSFLSLGFFDQARADMGRSLSDFQSEYGEPQQVRPTSTGKIVAFKADDMVIMGEFGPDGRARNVAYRITEGMTEDLISSLLSRSSAMTGSFYRVDKPKLSSTIDKLTSLKMQPGADTPPELLQLSKSLNPQVIAQLKSTLGSLSDLRATHDGKYIAMIDHRGSILVMEINGPMLPLAE